MSRHTQAVVRPRKPKSRTHHLDRRLKQIVALDTDNDDDNLLTTEQVAEWFGVSTQWLEIGRSKGWGPPFERIAPHLIRYRRGKVRSWLDGRSHSSTSEYMRGAKRARRAQVEA
jgi:hypothetical protein